MITALWPPLSGHQPAMATRWQISKRCLTTWFCDVRQQILQIKGRIFAGQPILKNINPEWNTWFRGKLQYTTLPNTESVAHFCVKFTFYTTNMAKNVEWTWKWPSGCITVRSPPPLTSLHKKLATSAEWLRDGDGYLQWCSNRCGQLLTGK